MGGLIGATRSLLIKLTSLDLKDEKYEVGVITGFE
jgi:hypothetical protein